MDAARTHNVGLIDITPITPYFFQRELVLRDEFIAPDAWPEHPLNPFPEQAREAMPWSYLPMLLARSNPIKTPDGWLSRARTARTPCKAPPQIAAILTSWAPL